MKSITYSFVIPHHNTPDLLERLLDSIPEREDIEIIVVDDNSDDDKKANVTRSGVKTIFISKEQTKGAGHARNVGIDHASGKWLMFADADDFYMPNFIEVLDDYKDDDIDMLFFNIGSVDYQTLQPDSLNRAAMHRKLIKDYLTTGNPDNLLFLGYGPWRKMLRTEFVKSHGIYFEEVPKDNDHRFALITSYFAKKWKVDERTVYSLTYYENSITYGKLTREKCCAHFNVLRRRTEFHKFIGHPEWNRKCIRGRYFHSGFFWCCRLLKWGRKSGFRALYYYFSNFIEMERGKSLYVDLIKAIESKQINIR